MTTEEKVTMIECLVANHKRVERCFDDMDKVLRVVDTEIHEKVWRAMNGYSDAVSFAVGDAGGWVVWFLCENEHGKKGLSVRIDGKDRKCNTVKQLVAIIESKGNA